MDARGRLAGTMAFVGTLAACTTATFAPTVDPDEGGPFGPAADAGRAADARVHARAVGLVGVAVDGGYERADAPTVGASAEDAGSSDAWFSEDAESGDGAAAGDADAGAALDASDEGEGDAQPEADADAVDAPADAASDGPPPLDASSSDASLDASAPDGSPDALAADASPDAPVADASPDSTVADASPDAPFVVPPAPATLEETGLYSDFAARTLAPGVEPYEPAFKLWSDGAEKLRWVWLPPGTRIDVGDPDHWIFPVGTRFYKQFVVAGRPAETRFLQKVDPITWFAATYAWNDAGTATTRVTEGVDGVFGTEYRIPSQADCVSCHQGGSDWVLGFELIGLANEGATGLTLAALRAADRLTVPLTGDYTVPGDATARSALGYLHANCGTACHNSNPTALSHLSGLRMRLQANQLGSVETTDTYETAVGIESGWQPAEGPHLLRVAPGDPDHSAIVYRPSARYTLTQMPPIATRIVDATGLAAITAWVASLR